MNSNTREATVAPVGDRGTLYTNMPGRKLEVDKMFLAMMWPKSTQNSAVNHFYQDNRIILRVLQVMGQLPIRFTPNGCARFSVRSALALHSALLYSALVFAAVQVWRVRLPGMLALYHADQFDAALMQAVMLTVVLVIFILPVASWMDARGQASYFEAWSRFQYSYWKVTGSPLTLSLGARSKLTLVSVVSLTISLAVALCLLPFDLEPWHALPYGYSVFLLFSLPGLLNLYCSAVRRAASSFGSQLLQLGTASYVSSSIISEYRGLWLDLSALCRATGVAFGFSGHFYIMYMFLLLTMALYAVLSDIEDGVSGMDVCMLIGGSGLLVNMCRICDSAHRTIQEVGPRVRQQVHALGYRLPSSDKAARREVREFLHAMNSAPPKVNLRELLDVDRSLVVMLMGTIVSYLVVLLQFRMSMAPSTNSSNTNSTREQPKNHG